MSGKLLKEWQVGLLMFGVLFLVTFISVFIAYLPWVDGKATQMELVHKGNVDKMILVNEHIVLLSNNDTFIIDGRNDLYVLNNPTVVAIWDRGTIFNAQPAYPFKKIDATLLINDRSIWDGRIKSLNELGSAYYWVYKDSISGDLLLSKWEINEFNNQILK